MVRLEYACFLMQAPAGRPLPESPHHLCLQICCCSPSIASTCFQNSARPAMMRRVTLRATQSTVVSNSHIQPTGSALPRWQTAQVVMRKADHAAVVYGWHPSPHSLLHLQTIQLPLLALPAVLSNFMASTSKV